MGKEPKKKSIIGIVICGVIIVAVVVGGVYAFMSGMIGSSKGGKVTTVSESTLKKVIKISELSTIKYTYNAIVPVYDEDGTTLKCHVAYEGYVKAGIDFEKVKIKVDEENKKVTITIPEVEIQECGVELGKMSYIFAKEKYNTEIVSTEAYQKSIADLEERAAKEEDLLSLAKENAISAVTGLTEPWIKQVDSEYSIEVN